MKKASLKLATILCTAFILFSSCSQNQNEATGGKLPLKTGNEYLDIFMADGDRMMLISSAIPIPVTIIAVLKRTLRSLRLSGTITMQPDTASGGLIHGM